MKIIGKMSHSSRRWLDRQHSDLYVKKAVKEGYQSRAAYKLIEMDDKFHLIKNAKHIVDIGASPGGWCQVISQRSSDDVKIVAIDLLPFATIEKVTQIIGDFEDEKIQQETIDFLGTIDLIVSDIAPSTVGHRQSDHLRIMGLVESVYDFAQNTLKNGGSFVVKIFQGGEEKKFFDLIKKDFQKTHFFKPKSSRSDSSEIYIVALHYKKG